MNIFRFAILALFFMTESIQPQTKIELFDLVKMFMPAAEYNLDDWMTGADDNTPIDWKTDGTKDVKQKDFDSDLGSYYREGKVIVTINKTPLYFLAKKKEALPWEVKLYGPRAGISAIIITNNLISPYNIFNPQLLESYFKKKGGKITLVKCDKQNELIGGSRLYKLTLKNENTIYLFLDFSLGSAGYDGSLILLISEPNTAFCLKRNLVNNNCK